MSISWKTFDHRGSGYTARHPAQEWQKHREFLTRRHYEGVSRRLMVIDLAGKGFVTTESQLNRQMTRWGLRASEVSRTTRSNAEPITRSSKIPAMVCKVEDSMGFQLEHIREASTSVASITKHEQDSNEPEVKTDTDCIDHISRGLCQSEHHRNKFVTCVLPLGAGASVLTNLGRGRGRAMLSQKLEAMELMNGQLPWIECCCWEFFHGMKPFYHHATLYHTMLTRPFLWGNDSTNSGFQHIYQGIALINLCRIWPTLPDNIPRLNAEKLSSNNLDVLANSIPALRTACAYYTSLLERPRVKNEVAFFLACKLASVCVPDLDIEKDLMLTGYPSETDKAVVRLFDTILSQRGRYKGTHNILMDLEDGLSSMYEPIKTRSNQGRWYHQFANALCPANACPIAVALEECREVLSAQKHAVVKHFWDNRDCDNACKHDGLSDHCMKNLGTKRLEIAANISFVFMSNLQQMRSFLAGSPNFTSIVVFFDTVGFIIADAVWRSIKPRHQRRELAAGDLPKLITDAINLLDTTSRSEASLQVLRRRLSQAWWMCDPDIDLFGPEGLHLGSCAASKCWEMLSRRITEFDRDLSPSESVQSATRQTYRPTYEVDGYEDVSMLSQSSTNSLKMFQKLAMQLRYNETILSLSNKSSQWSGHMSVDSWQFDTLVNNSIKT